MISSPEREPLAAGPLVILHADAALLVVNKPAGMLSVPGRGEDKQDSVATRLTALYADALVVHRLDMATSGLLLFARGPQMQSRLSVMFRDRRIDKRYVAVVAGRIEPESGTIDLPLAADWPRRPRQRVDHQHGRPSLTHYRTIPTDFDPSISRLELTPVTGRTHQLRVHLAAVGHPILGDALYGDASAAERLLLHASHLEFDHPHSGARVELHAPPDF